MEENDLKQSEQNTLIRRAKAGDNEAWERLCANYQKYIRKLARDKLRSSAWLRDRISEEPLTELEQAGWIGFVDAMKHFDPERENGFLSYATAYISGEMSRELGRLLNPLGILERPEITYDEEGNAIGVISAESLDEGIDAGEGIIPSVRTAREPEITLPPLPDRGKYSAERRALQILEVLRLLTDEQHSLTKEELARELKLYRAAKYQNGAPPEADNTLTKTIDEILQELNPEEYTEETREQYRIRYGGYERNLLNEKRHKKGQKKAPSITDFSYVHMFSDEELDELLQIIALSDLLAHEEKERLIRRLMGTASVYYQNPFWNGANLAFPPKGIYSRASSRDEAETTRLAGQLQTIQQAIKEAGQIAFIFNTYTAAHGLVPKSGHRHRLSPYHLVVYHDQYYCIGCKQGDDRIWHYRVDLMSEIEILTDETGKVLPARVTPFEGLPISGSLWDPARYMSEHLYMAFDAPRRIRVKIPREHYTILHDWFGDFYEKTSEVCEDGYDIIAVTTSPFMIARWALQYAEHVEIMDEEVREEIGRLLKGLEEKYGVF